MTAQEYINMIFDDANTIFPYFDEYFKKIESALGIKLFVWQKTLIATGYMRRTGETTARAIRDLTILNKPIVLSTDPRLKSYAWEVIKIKKKLNDAGIQTNEVILPRGKKI